MKTKLILSTFLFGGSVFLAPNLGAEDIDVETLWAKNCKKCHGADGKAQTRVGKKLNLRSYTDAEVQASFTDEEAIKITMEGVVDEATGKETMKPMKDKLSEAEIKALVVYIRAFAASE